MSVQADLEIKISQHSLEIFSKNLNLIFQDARQKHIALVDAITEFGNNETDPNVTHAEAMLEMYKGTEEAIKEYVKNQIKSVCKTILKRHEFFKTD